MVPSVEDAPPDSGSHLRTSVSYSLHLSLMPCCLSWTTRRDWHFWFHSRFELIDLDLLLRDQYRDRGIRHAYAPAACISHPASDVIGKDVASHVCNRECAVEGRHGSVYAILSSHPLGQYLGGILGCRRGCVLDGFDKTLDSQLFLRNLSGSGSCICHHVCPERLTSRNGKHFHDRYLGIGSTYSPKNGTIMVGRALTKPQAVVPAPP